MRQRIGGTNLRDLSNQTILVTAAAAGIGRATVLQLLADGAQVTATDIDAAGLDALQQDAGGGLKTALMDATDADAITRVVGSRDDWTGLYNGVGWVAEGTLASTTRNDWDTCWTINVTSMFMVTQAILPCFLANGRGAILNVSSVASSLKGLPNRFAYSATKAAVLGLTKSIAADYVGQGIRANAICPGTVETPSLHARINNAGDPKTALENFIARQPIGHLGQPEDIAEIASFLLSDSAGYVTGAFFTLDGGITL